MALSISDFELIANSSRLPEENFFSNLLNGAVATLMSEDAKYRPESCIEQPGALLEFNDDIPTIIVPDLHARVYFLMNLLKYDISSFLHENNTTVFDALQQGKVRVICLGDGLHSEKRGKERWLKAFEQ